VPTDGWRGIVEGFGRGVTNTYIHNSGSAEEQKGFVGEKELHDRAPADRTRQEAGLVLFLGDAHGLQQGENREAPGGS